MKKSKRKKDASIYEIKNPEVADVTNMVVRGCCTKPGGHPFVLIEVGGKEIVVETSLALMMGWQMIAAATEASGDSALIHLLANKTKLPEDGIARMLRDLHNTRSVAREALGWPYVKPPEPDQGDGDGEAEAEVEITVDDEPE